MPPPALAIRPGLEDNLSPSPRG